MGTEAFWVPAIASMVAAGSTYVNNRNTAKRQDNIALQGIMDAANRQKRADEVTKKVVDDLAASNPADARASTLGGFIQRLAQEAGNTGGSLTAPGGASSAFARDAADAALGVSDYGRQFAGNMATISAAGDQRRQEAIKATNAATALALLGREQEGQDRYNKLRMQAVRSNPWLSALSQVAQGVAVGYTPAAGAGSAGAAAAGGSYNPYDLPTVSTNAALDPNRRLLA